ncbi:hypothetical protein [Arthrobacter psychrochitiniphilus]|uniref:hypothetical protein n=1 Tax=Arthrobacter psychrochitiniphilus TaxID=291045 RepID=UPI003F7BBB80
MDIVPGQVGDIPFCTRTNASTSRSSSPVARKAKDTAKTSDTIIAIDSDMANALARQRTTPLLG